MSGSGRLIGPAVYRYVFYTCISNKDGRTDRMRKTI